MKKIIAFLLIFVTMTVVSSAQSPKPASGKLLRHVVLFKFKENTTAADIKKVEDGFRALPSKITEVKAFEWGKNNSPEKLNQEFTHCFVVSFSSEKDREIYLPHPAHKAFVAVLEPFIDKVLVIDYWAGR